MPGGLCVVGAGRRHRRPAHGSRRSATGPPPPLGGGHWAGWAFLAPVTVYLVAFYAYPMYRNIDLSLRHYTVRSFVNGGAPSPDSPTTARCSAIRRSPRRWNTR